MAKIKSTFFGFITGKWGGSVFYNGANGWIIVRDWVVPVNPATPYQVAARERFTNASKDWSKLLTEANRDSWIDYAKNTPYTKGGNQYILSGSQMYIAVRTSVMKGAPLTVPSAFSTCACEPGMLHDLDIGVIPCPTPLDCGGAIKITNTDPALAISGYVELSPPQNQSVKFYKGPFDPKTTVNFGTILPGGNEDVEFCDDTCEGSRYFYRVRSYTTATPYKISNVQIGSYISTCTPV